MIEDCIAISPYDPGSLDAEPERRGNQDRAAVPGFQCRYSLTIGGTAPSHQSHVRPPPKLSYYAHSHLRGMPHHGPPAEPLRGCGWHSGLTGLQIGTLRFYLPPPRKPCKWDIASSVAGSLFATRTVTPKAAGSDWRDRLPGPVRRTGKQSSG